MGMCSGTAALLDIPRHALGEKFHGHVQHLPHIAGAADQGHFPAYFEGINRLRPGNGHLQNAQADHQADEGHQPIPIRAGQQPVHKHLGHDGIHDTE